MIYQILKHTHSGIRWIVLLILLITILIALLKMILKASYSKTDRTFSIICLASIHIQLLTGLLLYFISPKVVFQASSMSNSMLRFFLVEHAILMLLAVAVITLGYRFVKKASSVHRKHLNTLLFSVAALLIILISIPWPWKDLGGTWF